LITAASSARQLQDCRGGDARENIVNDMLRDLSDFMKRSDTVLRGILDEIVLDQEREEDKKEDIEKKRGVT
jgi:hypothetical protein